MTPGAPGRGPFDEPAVSSGTITGPMGGTITGTTLGPISSPVTVALSGADPPAQPAQPVSRGFAIARSRLWLLACAVVATLGLAIFSMATLKWQADRFAEVPDAIDVRRAVRLMVIDALAAESAQRGFLLTGDRQYLDDFYAWDPHASLEDMRHTTHGILGAELAELEAVLDDKQREMRSTIQLYEGGDQAGAMAILNSDLGREHMVRARKVMTSLIELEGARVKEIFNSTLVLSQVAMPIIIGGAALTMFGLVTGFFALRSSTKALAVVAQKNAKHMLCLEDTGRELAETLEHATRSNRALARSNRDLNQFAYVASHDLKAPLRAISSLSTWIEEDLRDKIDDQGREHLRLMRSRIDRMSSLIEGILGYSRAGRETELTEVKTRDLIEELKDQQQLPAGVTLEVLPGPWPVLHTQRVQLVQVWSNLIGNACKHGVPSGGRVELGCDRDAESQLPYFWVRDSGPGIEPAYQRKIFELFQRLVSRDKVEGAGIGLSVVRKLVDGNGGRVWVESQPGDGTTFKFTWSSHDAA
jgi:signal transduction histidine kinase